MPTIKAEDTEPLEITVNAEGITNLDDLTSAVLYLRERSKTENHVDGATLTVSDSASRTLSFDPEDAKNGGGDALDTRGTYRGYVLITWSDGDVTRHPGEGHFSITVEENFE